MCNGVSPPQGTFTLARSRSNRELYSLKLGSLSCLVAFTHDVSCFETVYHGLGVEIYTLLRLDEWVLGHGADGLPNTEIAEHVLRCR